MVFGFRRAAGRRSMRDVIEAIDGTIYLNVCLTPGKSCSRKTSCPAHPVWAQAQQAMLDVLSNTSIAAMAALASISTAEPCSEPRTLASRINRNRPSLAAA